MNNLFFKIQQVFLIFVLMNTQIFNYVNTGTTLDPSKNGSRNSNFLSTYENLSPSEYVAGEVLVSFTDNVLTNVDHRDHNVVEKLLKDYGIKIKKHIFHRKNSNQQEEKIVTELPESLKNFYVLTFSPNYSLSTIISALIEIPEVDWAGPNSILKPQLTPNDYLFTNNELWGLKKINAENAWDITTGDSAIIIAFLDTGIEMDHPDLKAKIVDPYDVVDGDPTPQDVMKTKKGHGTHVAGIAAASSNNSGLGQDMTGVSWNAKITPIKICGLDAQGEENCTDADQIEGLALAIDNFNIRGKNIRVINMSLSGPGYVPAVQTLLNQAYVKNIVVVAASGNCGEMNYDPNKYCPLPRVNQVEYPAGYNHVIGVAATNQLDEKANFSTANSSVDVAAPGVNITSTFLMGANGGDFYATKSGTSMAAPFVSGLAALILTVNPNLKPDNVEKILQDSAIDLGSAGRDDSYGAGRIDAYRALLTTPMVVPSLVSPGHQSTTSIRPTFSWIASPTAKLYALQVSKTADFSSFVIQTTTSGTSYTPNFDLSRNTTYYWRVQAQRGITTSEISGTWEFTVPLTPPMGGDTTPPTVSFTSPSNGATISSRNVTISANASDNNGGSGIKEVRFSAKWNGNWYGIGTDNTSPYSVNWDMCNSNVPIGDVELGLEAWDNAGNFFVYSTANPNPHIYMSFNCGSSSGGSWHVRAWMNKYMAGYVNKDEYWNGINFERDWGTGAPYAGFPSDGFSFIIDRQIYFPGGTYTFRVFSDDGVRLFVDGQKRIDEWWDRRGDLKTTVDLSPGNHSVQVEYYENAGDAAIKLWIWGPGIPQPELDPPDGRITSPTNNSFTNRSQVQLLANAWDDVVGVQQVKFKLYHCLNGCNWYDQWTDNTEPYTFDWLTNGFEGKQVKFAIDVTDKSGKTRSSAGGEVTVTIDKDAPTVNFIAPARNSNDSDKVVDISLNAADILSGVSFIRFYAGYNFQNESYWHEVGTDNNGSDGWGMRWNATSLPNGTNVNFYVVAYDNAGNQMDASQDGITLGALTGCFNLSVKTDPVLEGTVSVKTPPNCNSAQYSAGTVVQIAATPPSGFNFVGWLGDVDSSSSSISVTMNSNKNIVASYVQQCYSFSITVNPIGSGDVSVSAPPNCNGTQYLYGTMVEVTASPKNPNFFGSWSGDISSSTNPSSIRLDGNKSIVANFIQMNNFVYLPILLK